MSGPTHLLFYCVPGDVLPEIRRHGLAGDTGYFLWKRLEDAAAGCKGSMLVIDAAKLPEAPREAGSRQVRVAGVPPDGFCNLEPYLPPKPVPAAGGYVVRSGPDGLDVLLIFRRGVWDLPKGKLDVGETLEEAALREVSEETGLRGLRIRQALGTTQHGYPERGAYRVKTTYWYWMETSEEAGSPQQEEGIEAVVWVPWEEAKERIGYETLRRHMAHVDRILREVPARP